jgi:phosphoribosylglycinamide formyltransferase-1
VARLAVFASGRGSNFVAIADALRAAGRHGIEFLLCDVEGAPVLERARDRGIPTFPVSYAGQSREAVEKKVVRHLERRRVDIVTPACCPSIRGRTASRRATVRATRSWASR